MTINAYSDQLKMIAEANGMNEDELENKLKSAFDWVDKNKDGGLSADEVAPYGISAQHFKAYAGSDNNGSLDDFVKWNLDNYKKDPTMYEGFFEKGVKTTDIEENAPDAIGLLSTIFTNPTESKLFFKKDALQQIQASTLTEQSKAYLTNLYNESKAAKPTEDKEKKIDTVE